MTVDLEHKTGITGVPFGRTALSLRLSRIEFCAIEHREGPEGPGVQGMPEKFDVHVCLDLFVTQKNMKMGDEDCWILEFRAENDTK